MIKLSIIKGKMIKNFIVRVILIIFLINIIPLQNNKKNSLNYIQEAKAFATQLDCVAPGYIINAELGGITFDLSNRLTDTMTVESFSFKNTNPEKQKRDVKEKNLDNGAKWLSTDALEHGDIYEIEANIYDSSTQKNTVFINSFKFYDKNLVFNPSINIRPFKSQDPKSKYETQDVEVDLSECEEILSHYKNIKIDILKSNLAQTPFKTYETNINTLKSFGYKVIYPRSSMIFDINKDYIVRVTADNKIFEKIVSVNVKSNPKINVLMSADQIKYKYDQHNGRITFTIPDLGISRDYYEVEVEFSDPSGRLNTVKVVGRGYSNVIISVPYEYYGIIEPSNLNVYIKNPDGQIELNLRLQVTFPKKDNKSGFHFWFGVGLRETREEKLGFYVKKIHLTENDYITIPHSWDKFPRAHYITMYDAMGQTQIGGEYRYDVVELKREFVNKDHDISGANFLVKYADMKHGFNSYSFKIESSNYNPDWASAYIPFLIYSEIAEINKLNVLVSDLSVSGDGKGANFVLTPKNVPIKVNDKMSIIDDKGTEHVAQTNNAKNFTFSNIPILFGGKYIVTLNNITSLVYFNSTEASVLFNPTVVGSTSDGEDTINVNIDKNQKHSINVNSSQNRIRILYMNGNSTGNEFTNVSVGDNKYRLTSSLVNGENYILELNNGKDTFKTTFEYTPLKLNINSFSETTTTLGWVYPNNYLIMEGDTLNIYFKKDGYNYPAVPDAKIVHGFQSIDFDTIKTYTVKNLSPNVNYTAKLELITSDNIKFSSEVSFVTSEFRLLDEYIEGMSENGIVNDKNIDIVWDVTKSDIEFSRDDRIDIFLKLKSHDAFPRTPTYTIKEDLNRIRKARIKVDTYEESYSVKVVYNIGGVKYSSKVINFTVALPEFKASVSKISESSVKVDWEYPQGTEFSKDQSINVFLKKSIDASYPQNPNFQFIEGGTNQGLENKTLKDIVTCDLNNLQENTNYQVKVEYKIDEKSTAGVLESVKKESILEFKTTKFLIDEISIKDLSNKEVELKWSVSNNKYPYTSKDQIKVYLKEKSQYEYGNPIDTKTTDLSSANKVKIAIPKYDTEYDIKITYVLNDKEVNAYTEYKLKIGDIPFKITNITDKSVTISWEYPKGYVMQEGDKVEIFQKNNNNWDKKASNTQSSSYDLSSFKTHVITDLTKDNKYDIKCVFTPKYGTVKERICIFKAVEGFQIYKIDAVGINSTTVNLSWAFYPEDYKFDIKDTLEIYKVEMPKEEKEQKEQKVDIFQGINSIFDTKKNLSTTFNYIVKDLNIDKEYTFRIKYTLNNEKTQENASRDTQSAQSDQGKIKVVYEDIKGKPDFGDFNFSVLDSGYTGVNIGVNYPENYEIKQGDILDIYIKKKENINYDTSPNFTVKHGSKEDEVDLNEYTSFDILGLAPDTGYKAKVIFWPEGGKGNKKEKELTFQTKHIEGISDVKVVDVIDHVVNVGVEFEQGKELYLGENDYCKVYIKKKTETDYPSESSGESYGDTFNEKHFVSSYFEDLDTEYNLKAIVNIGGAVYEKEVEFISKVDDLNIEIKEVNPMSAQLEWKYPNNYKLVDGEYIEVYIKYKEDSDYNEDPDLEIIQSEESSLVDINLIELYELVPDTEYEIKVKLNLTEADLPEIVKEFKTAPFNVTNFEIKGITEEGVAVSWELDNEEVEFIDDVDNLAFFVKKSNEDDYDFENPIAEFTTKLTDLRTALLPIDEEMNNVDILLSYLIENYESNSEIIFNSVKLDVSTEESVTTVRWEYPNDIEFEEGDMVNIYVKYSDEISYPKEPIFRSVHGSDQNLKDIKEISMENMQVGSYTLKFSLITENLNFNPVEVNFQIGGGFEDVIEVNVSNAIGGRSVVVDSNYSIDIDYDKNINVKPQGLKVQRINNEKEGLLKITDLVPGKKYEEITINAISKENREINLIVQNVLVEAETLLEQFLTNIYSFAFERFPDEGGYSYWLSNLMDKKEITGKYVLYNLMFSEREFSDRNLPDNELIKVLYQIVVNRKYDDEGFSYWIKEYNENYLPQANNDSYEAQKAIVTRMIHEQEFKNLCNKMGILW